MLVNQLLDFLDADTVSQGHPAESIGRCMSSICLFMFHDLFLQVSHLAIGELAFATRLAITSRLTLCAGCALGYSLGHSFFVLRLACRIRWYRSKLP